MPNTAVLRISDQWIDGNKGRNRLKDLQEPMMSEILRTALPAADRLPMDWK